MKILQLTGYFFPEKAASIYLEENRIQAFANAGFNMVIYASRPTRGLSKEEYQEYKKKKEEVLYNGKLIEYYVLSVISYVGVFNFGMV